MRKAAEERRQRNDEKQGLTRSVGSKIPKSCYGAALEVVDTNDGQIRVNRRCIHIGRLVLTAVVSDIVHFRCVDSH